MPVKSFYDLQVVMDARPHLLGPSAMVEFSFIAYYAAFSDAVADATAANAVLQSWGDACRRIHPTREQLALHCLESAEPDIDQWQLSRDPAQAFTFVAKSLTAVLHETIAGQAPSLNSVVPGHQLNEMAEKIRITVSSGNFFYQKARAYEGYCLGLISAYEYLALGSFEGARSGELWRREVEMLPFSATRTLADFGRPQTEIVQEALLFSEEQKTASYAQVRNGLLRVFENSTLAQDDEVRRRLGFPKVKTAVG